MKWTSPSRDQQLNTANRRQLAGLLLAGAAACFCTRISHAHGLPLPKYGGLTATALDLGFEIYMAKRRLCIYVTDHDSPFDTRAFEAKVQIGKRVIHLVSAPDAKLMSTDTHTTLNLSLAILTLSASVLPRPVTVDFRR